MKPRTLIQSIRLENKFRLKLIPLGWEHHGDWRFSHNGILYDLSATDLDYAIKNY